MTGYSTYVVVMPIHQNPDETQRGDDHCNWLKETYPNDRQKMQQELMALYKKEGENPIAGCLAIFLQIPIFFSLYKVLFVTI